MPRFFLPKGVTPLDHIHSLEIRPMSEDSKLDSASKFQSVSVNIGSLSYKEKWNLYQAMKGTPGDGDGTLRKYTETRTLISDFNKEGTPDNIPAFYQIKLGTGKGDNKFLDFLDAVAKHTPPNSSKKYDKSFHIYIGRMANKEYFNLIIVPAFSEELTTTTSSRDHAKDIEWKAFPHKTDFFAYVVKKGSNEISTDLDDCAKLISIKDIIPSPGSPTQVVFYTYDAFKEFQGGLIDSSVEELLVEFGRDNHKCTLILTFLKGGNPVNCKIVDSRVGTIKAEGICFDKGDLIPPPDEKTGWDSSFPSQP